jgi:hypothetical protein
LIVGIGLRSSWRSSGVPDPFKADRHIGPSGVLLGMIHIHIEIPGARVTMSRDLHDAAKRPVYPQNPPCQAAGIVPGPGPPGKSDAAGAVGRDRGETIPTDSQGDGRASGTLAAASPLSLLVRPPLVLGAIEPFERPGAVGEAGDRGADAVEHRNI